MHTRHRFCFVAAVLAGCVSACTDVETNSPKPCNEAPFECAAGQTCWPNQSSAFQCLPAGAGKTGDACQLVVGAPTCGEGLICLMQGSAGGTCTPYCVFESKDHICPSNEICANFTLAQGNQPLTACQADGGAGAGK